MIQKNNFNVVSFKDLDIDESIMFGVEEAGFSTLTEIQRATLPLTLAGYDVMGVAQTGTGKTATFLISLLNYLLVNPVKPGVKGPWAIILAPTRELAIQIKKDLNQLGKYTGLTSLVLYGGVPIENQKRLLTADIDILIGTPGRIIDLYKQKAFKLKQIDVVVLDEADRMFDLGFIDDVKYLIKQMPPAEERLNLLFSATMSERVKELAYEYFNAPKLVTVGKDKPANSNIDQVIYHIGKNEKNPLLLSLLEKEKPTSCIIFLNTKKELGRLSSVLSSNKYKNMVLSGDISQNKREYAVKLFTEGEFNILIATDVAARGLHIPNVSHVFNYDLPQTAEDYVHRIGRTARAGATGKAISFADEEYVYSLNEIERYLGNKIPVKQVTEELLSNTLAKDPLKAKYNLPNSKDYKQHVNTSFEYVEDSAKYQPLNNSITDNVINSAVDSEEYNTEDDNIIPNNLNKAKAFDLSAKIESLLKEKLSKQSQSSVAYAARKNMLSTYNTTPNINQQQSLNIANNTTTNLNIQKNKPLGLKNSAKDNVSFGIAKQFATKPVTTKLAKKNVAPPIGKLPGHMPKAGPLRKRPKIEEVSAFVNNTENNLTDRKNYNYSKPAHTINRIIRLPKFYKMKTVKPIFGIFTLSSSRRKHKIMPKYVFQNKNQLLRKLQLVNSYEENAYIGFRRDCGHFPRVRNILFQNKIR